MTGTVPTLARAAADHPLDLRGDVLRWAGPALRGGPRVAVTLRGPWVAALASGDLGGLVAAPPDLPPGLCAALAEHLVDHPGLASRVLSGRPAAGPLRRALLRALLYAGHVEADGPPARAAVLADLGAPVRAVAEGPGGALFAATPSSLHRLGGDGPRAWALSEGAAHSLVEGLAPSDGLAIASVADGRVVLRALGEDGEPGEHYSAGVPGAPLAFARRGAHCWLLTSEALALLQPGTDGGDAALLLRAGRFGLWPGPTAHGRWLALPLPDRYTPTDGWVSDGLAWVDLEAATSSTIPWICSGRHTWHEGTLWGCADDGVWRAPPGEAREVVDPRPSLAIAFHEGRRWVAGAPTRVDGEDLGFGPGFDLVPLPGGVAVSVLGGAVLRLPGGDIRWTQPGDLSGAWAGEVGCVARGDRLAVVGPEGVRGEHQMPHDGRLVGATPEAFLFGRQAGGNPRTVGVDVIAIGLDGRTRDRVAVHDLWRDPVVVDYAGGTRAREGLVAGGAVVLTGRTSVGRWTPRLAPRVAPPPPQREERGRQVLGYEEVNPRDAWPRPGHVAAAADVVLVEGRYEGSRGVAPAEGLLAERGAAVVAVGCAFRGGVRAVGGSFVLLVDCEVEGGISVEDGSAVCRL